MTTGYYKSPILWLTKSDKRNTVFLCSLMEYQTPWVPSLLCLSCCFPLRFPRPKIFSGNFTPCCFYLFKSCLVVFISHDSKWVVLFPTFHTERIEVEKLSPDTCLSLWIHRFLWISCSVAEKGKSQKIRAIMFSAHCSSLLFLTSLMCVCQPFCEHLTVNSFLK